TKHLHGFSHNLNPGMVPETHRDLFRKARAYYKDDKNNLYIHGGFNRHALLRDQHPESFFWDRNLWRQALSFRAGGVGKFKMVEEFNQIFIGHTATTHWGKDEERKEGQLGDKIITVPKHPITTPMKAANIINLDTGAGFAGKLTLWCVDDGHYVQSDLVH